MTGAAAEALGRQWISVELDPTYVQASHFRFEERRVASEPHALDKVNGVAPTESLFLFSVSLPVTSRRVARAGGQKRLCRPLRGLNPRGTLTPG